MDRFLIGFLSGSSSGILLNIWGFFVKDLLHFSTRNYVDWMAVVLYGLLPTHWYDFFLAFLAHLLWTGLLGVILAYLLPKLTYQNYWLKGALYGYTLGILIYGSAILLRMPFFTMIPFPTTLGNAIGGILWGVTTAHLVYWLDKDKKQTTK